MSAYEVEVVRPDKQAGTAVVVRARGESSAITKARAACPPDMADWDYTARLAPEEE